MWILIRQASRVNGFAVPQLVRLSSSIQLLNESILTRNKETKSTIDKATRSLFTNINEASWFKPLLPLQLQKRLFKESKKSREEAKDEEKEEESQEEELDELAALGKELGFQDRSTTVPTTRLDEVAKVGLGFSKAQVEQLFQDNRIRLNGERIANKSVNVRQGDEIDAILGLNFDNRDMLDVIRCEILELDPKLSKTGRAKVKYRRHNKIVIHNYEDPYTGLLISQRVSIREEILRGSGRVVITAVFVNGANFLFKTIAWLYTGSHSLFAEAIHSLADTCNQLILAFGIRKSLQTPNEDHPYGYHPMRYVASLISGVGIFCAGTGLSLYHGINGLLHPEQMESLYWAFFILGGSLISEGGTLLIAVNAALKGARRAGMGLKEYIFRSQDPSVNVVLLEDLAAVVGVVIAGTCMGLTSYFNTPIYDATGSLIVGGLLGVVASFIIYTNSGALVGRSIPIDRLQEINKLLEADEMIRAIHDVKATDMGNDIVRYKAEVDFDGRRLTGHYIDSIDLQALLKEMQTVRTTQDAEAFILKHGENIVDLLGAEVDRIEKELKKKHPQIRHVDLEVL